MSTIPNLEELCAIDGRKIGDHTMREWAAHLDADPHTDLPFEEIPDGPVMFNTPDGGVPLADSIVARAGMLDGNTGQAVVQIPLIVLDFQLGRPGAAPSTFYTVGLVAPPDTMRKIGKLLRDTAYGAASAAEKAARG